MKFAMVRSDIPTTQESLHIKIINEEIVHHFLWYEMYCSLWINSTRPNSQPNLLYGNTEAECRKRPKLWPNDWILHCDSSSQGAVFQI